MKNLILLICLFSFSKVLAQDPALTRKEKMKPALFLTGNWQGEGWMVMQDGKKHYFKQTEKVISKLDGGLLVVEGKGTDPETGKNVHDAFAFLTFDVVKSQYRWTAMTAVGYITDVIPEVRENTFIWGLENARIGKIRYTITLDKGEWLEIGEASKDGGVTWVKNFEMRLKKI